MRFPRPFLQELGFFFFLLLAPFFFFFDLSRVKCAKRIQKGERYSSFTSCLSITYVPSKVMPFCVWPSVTPSAFFFLVLCAWRSLTSLETRTVLLAQLVAATTFAVCGYMCAYLLDEASYYPSYVLFFLLPPLFFFFSFWLIDKCCRGLVGGVAYAASLLFFFFFL